MISKEAIEEYRAVYKKDIGKELSDLKSFIHMFNFIKNFLNNFFNVPSWGEVHRERLEETRRIKQEAKERGEIVRVYYLSNDSKLYVFYKDGRPVRSAIKSLAWGTLDYYDNETTQGVISFWQKLGKIPR